MSSTVHVMVGIPGSGKSTQAKKIMAESDVIVRSSYDDYRLMFLHGNYKFVSHSEKLMKILQKKAIEECVKNSVDILVDNTNCNLQNNLMIVGEVHKIEPNARVVFHIMDASNDAELCNYRIENRALRGGLFVPRDAVDNLHRCFVEMVPKLLSSKKTLGYTCEIHKN